MEAWGGGVDELKHMRNLLKRETFERSGSLQIPALKWLDFSWSAINRVKLRSKAENGSSASAESLLQIDMDVSQSGLYSSTEKLIRLIQRIIMDQPHKLEDEEQFPLHRSPLWRRLGSQLAFGAVVSGLSGLINPKRASIPGGTWRGRVFSTWATRGGVNYATCWREEARLGIVLAFVWFADIIGTLVVGGQTHKSGTSTQWGEKTGGLEGPHRTAHAVKYWSNKYFK